MMKKIFNQTGFIFFLVLVIYLPFADLISNALEWKTSLSQGSVFWLTHWYIFVSFVLLLAAMILALCRKSFVSKSQIIGTLLLMLGLLSIFLIAPTISRGMEGFRIALFGLVFYLLAGETDFSKKWFKHIANTYLIVAVLVAFWALLERLFQLRYWGAWNVINPETVFGYGWHSTGSLMQSASFLGGPNQLASYLLPAVFIVLIRVWDGPMIRSKILFYYILSALYLITIFFTSSRSAMIGLVVGLLILAWTQKSKILKIGILSGLAVVAILSFWLVSSSQYKDIFSHGLSQAGHIESLKVSSVEIKNRFSEPVKLFFGAGIGTAGPLAIKYGGIISESWFLQILLELGIVGLLLYILFFYFVGQGLWRKKETGLFYGFIAVLVASLFLHTLSDNPALTYTLFVLIGLKLSKETNG